MTRVDIARVCHEVNRAYCKAIGDHTQVAWEEAPRFAQRSVLEGVAKALDDPSVTPEVSHQSWMDHHREHGWSYGPIKDYMKREHPAMVPYDELPPEQRAKDSIFLAVVRALAPHLAT